MASVYSRILTATAEALSAVTETPIVIRDRPYLDQQRGDTLPIIVISPRVEISHNMTFTDHAIYGYPVVVSYICPGGLMYDNPHTTLDERERIRKNLFVTALPGVTEVFDCLKYDPSPVFDLSLLDTSLRVSLQEFVYLSEELR